MRTDPAMREVVETLHKLARLAGQVELVACGPVPNDGKVIVDEQ